MTQSCKTRIGSGEDDKTLLRLGLCPATQRVCVAKRNECKGLLDVAYQKKTSQNFCSSGFVLS